MSKKGTLDHKCPNCSAVLKFSPHGQNWKCEYCKSDFNKAEIDAYEAKRGNVIEENAEAVKMSQDEHGMDIYMCPNCGAEVIADENTTATFCVYCKNTAILKNKLVGVFNPSKLIPFHKTKEDAIKAFEQIRKGRPFAPKCFSDPKNIEEMRGIYVPFWVYDFHAQGYIQADAKKITSWTMGDYRYTKTDSYSVIREGDMSYYMIPVDGSEHFKDEMMNSIEPYDYKGLLDFSHSYLSGFLAEKYNVSADIAEEDASNRAKNSTTDILRGNVSGYTTVNVVNQNHKLASQKTEYVLFPVWLLNIKYKDKLHMFAMNGQTGKMIGDIPIDKKKATIWWIGLFLITFAICTVVWLLGGA